MLGLCIEMMAMRSGMKQAEYFVMEPEADTHHFALNFECPSTSSSITESQAQTRSVSSRASVA